MYQCSKCGAANVKLWRPYSSGSVELECIKHFDPEITAPFLDGAANVLGFYVPAVPHPDNDLAFYGYTIVPVERLHWWASLPVSN